MQKLSAKLCSLRRATKALARKDLTRDAIYRAGKIRVQKPEIYEHESNSLASLEILYVRPARYQEIIFSIQNYLLICLTCKINTKIVQWNTWMADDRCVS